MVDFALTEGIAGHSLRSIGEAVGTSHRMLIHHFGSKEGLLVDVTKAVEQRQRDVLDELLRSSASPAEAARRFWDHLTDGRLAPQERLFFELYGQALQGRHWARSMLPGVVTDWLGPLTSLCEAQGADRATATADARLALAVTRGLLLDLLATGDETGVHAAVDRLETLYRTTGSPAASWGTPS